ncbi:MAG: FeoB-associated Cys-rich membrane protein [Lachnospiraceae bacterium]|nr:FeoB-associated Cys-rich membrane protein [Lachnospiraceae bacterium]
MIDLIVVIILVLLFGWAISYMVRAKKEGVKCIGCPDAKSCSQKCSSCPGGCSADCQNTPDK